MGRGVEMGKEGQDKENKGQASRDNVHNKKIGEGVAGVRGQREALHGGDIRIANTDIGAGVGGGVAVPKHSELDVLVCTKGDWFGNGNREDGYELEGKSDGEDDAEGRRRANADAHGKKEKGASEDEDAKIRRSLRWREGERDVKKKKKKKKKNLK